MSEMSEEECLKKALNHWANHNMNHLEDYNKFVEQAMDLRLTEVVELLSMATGYLAQANDLLFKAAAEIGEE